MMYVVSILFNSLWEAPVIALCAWAALRIARNANATTRYAVWTAALLLSALLPIVTSLLTGPSIQDTVPVRTLAPSTMHVAVPPRPIQRSAVPVTHSAPPVSTPATFRRFEFRVPFIAAIALAALWALAALVNLVRFCFAFAALERLKRNATPFSVEYRDRLRRWNAQGGSSGRVRLCVSPEIVVPIAVGIFDAMILLPETLVDRLQPDDVDRILLHEFAHLRRGDDWINLVERVITAVYFFNPAIRAVARQADLEREISCDDSVLQRGGDALPYANCLAKMVEIVAWPYQPLAAPGVFDSRRNLSVRIERLLVSARDSRTRIAALPALAAVAAMLVLALAGSAFSPVFAYTRSFAAPEKTVAKVAASAAPVLAHATANMVADAVAKPHPKATPKTRSAPHPKPTPSPFPSRYDGGDFIGDLASAGYRNLSVDQLIQLKAVGVDAQYIRALANIGYTGLSPTDLVRLRAGNVSPDYVASMRKQFGALSVDQISQLGAMDVTPEYVAGWASNGFRGITPQQLVQLKALDIDSRYVHEIEQAGYANPTISDLVRLRAGNVTPDYVASMRALFGTLSLNQIAQLGAVGVTPEYVGELAKYGYTHLTSDQVMQLRELGVDGAFVQKAAAHGFRNLTVDQLIRLRAAGVL